uniref:Protein kinase domain-containing protein n=1 Tax=Timema bartmani TaxID=61472 RepID=A0A7R9HYS5_9NEOP|nr:unnamed protein product [Timema bartmani]
MQAKAKFSEKKPQCTRPGSNPALPIFGSLVQHECSALDHAAPEAGEDYIARYGRMTEGAARRKFWQILSAVEYCHNRRVVHRDLKVSNPPTVTYTQACITLGCHGSAAGCKTKEPMVHHAPGSAARCKTKKPMVHHAPGSAAGCKTKEPMVHHAPGSAAGCKTKKPTAHHAPGSAAGCKTKEPRVHHAPGSVARCKTKEPMVHHAPGSVARCKTRRVRLNLKEVYPHLHGERVENTLVTPNWDPNHDHPVICSPVSWRVKP